MRANRSVKPRTHCFEAKQEEGIVDQSQPLQNPAPEGVRIHWHELSKHLRSVIEEGLGSSVSSVSSQATGFSPGVAARLHTKDGRTLFLKAIGPDPNPRAPAQHRREASIVAGLPAAVPVPRLLWSYDDRASDWVCLVFEDVAGEHPEQPWQAEELARVLSALAELGATMTPTPIDMDAAGTASALFANRLSGWKRLRENETSQLDRLDAWSRHHIDALADLETEASSAVRGNTLLHLDVRGDNILLTPEQVWFLDWSQACVGAMWLDVVLFAPSVMMQGGPNPEDVIASHPAIRDADPAAVTAAIAALAGIFTYSALQPAPPGLPTVRAFLAAQGAVARKWIAQRTGWK